MVVAMGVRASMVMVVGNVLRGGNAPRVGNGRGHVDHLMDDKKSNRCFAEM